jgi:hypothetical protein
MRSGTEHLSGSSRHSNDAVIAALKSLRKNSDRRDKRPLGLKPTSLFASNAALKRRSSTKIARG